MNRLWSAKRTRLLLRRLRSPELIERDPVARSLRQALGTSTAREAVLIAIDRALPKDDVLRTSIVLVDVEGQSTKDAATKLHVVRRHFFRWRTTAMLRVAATIEQVLHRSSDLNVAMVADYTAGMRLWRHRSAPALTAALRHFESAESAHPHPARVLCGMAKAELIRAEYLLGSAPAGFAAAQALCDRAAELDPQCAEVFVVRADIAAFRDHDVARARKYINDALSLDPQSRDALVFGACHAAISGDTALGLDFVHDLLEMAPDAADARTAAGIVMHFAAMFDEAIIMLRSVVETDPTFAPARYFLAASFICTEKYADALVHLEAVPEFSKWQQFRALRFRCDLATGVPTDDRDLDDMFPYQRAIALIGRSDSTDALAALASVSIADCPWLPIMRADPLLRELRDCDAFRRLTGAVNY